MYRFSSVVSRSRRVSPCAPRPRPHIILSALRVLRSLKSASLRRRYREKNTHSRSCARDVSRVPGTRQFWFFSPLSGRARVFPLTFSIETRFARTSNRTLVMTSWRRLCTLPPPPIIVTDRGDIGTRIPSVFARRNEGRTDERRRHQVDVVGAGRKQERSTDRRARGRGTRFFSIHSLANSPPVHVHVDLKCFPDYCRLFFDDIAFVPNSETCL